MFELTYQCNFSCPHCYVPFDYRGIYKPLELTTQEVFGIFTQLKDIGCFYLGFTGGEIFTRKDIIEILCYAKSLGFELILYTNGSLIDSAIARGLSRLGVNKVDITIPAMTVSAFKRVSKKAGARDAVFRAVRLLRENGVAVGLKTCLLKDNEKEIHDIQGFAASLGLEHRLDERPSLCLDGSRIPYDYRAQIISLPPQSLSVAAEGHQKKRKEKKAKPEKLFFCGVGETQAALTPAGELKMCLMIDYPKFKVRPLEGKKGLSLKEAWDKLIKLTARIKADTTYTCDSCSLSAYCQWCPAKSWLEKKGFSSCDEDSRLGALLKKEGKNLYGASCAA